MADAGRPAEHAAKSTKPRRHSHPHVINNSAVPSPVHDSRASPAVKRHDDGYAAKHLVPEAPPLSPEGDQHSGSSAAAKSGSHLPLASMPQPKEHFQGGPQPLSPTPAVHEHKPKRKQLTKVKEPIWDNLGIVLGAVFVTAVVTALIIIKALINEESRRAGRLISNVNTSPSQLPYTA
ncbi:uncharacterized protein [Dermacentor albipictus]|uniref:uncharacterized protein isoform X2 n=1 Tax=Dermacentor albipictus TaxID=60249 RepID=UPI0038FC7C65